MSSYTPVSRQHHASCSWLSDVGLSAFAHTTRLPLAYSEVPRCLGEFPMAFERQDGSLRLVGLLGIDGGENLYLHPHKQSWMGSYVPATLRGEPFRLLPHPDTPDQAVLCVSMDAVIPGQDGQPFFDRDGKGLSGRLNEAAQFLQQRERSIHAATKAASALEHAGVLRLWEPEIALDASHSTTLDGLLCVDEAAMNKLDSSTLEQLHASRALPLAYAQLFSMAQLRQLEQRLRLIKRLASARVDDLVLDDGSDDDDDLVFDFDFEH